MSKAVDKQTLQDLVAKETSLQATIEKVLHFPEKVSYDVMVPLSKVAFYPARLIHTNEFQVLKPGLKPHPIDFTEMDFISHVDAAEELRVRLRKVQEEVKELQEKLGMNKAKTKSALKKASTPAASATNHTRESDPQPKTENNLTKAVKKVEEEKKILDTASAASPVYEIREFIDDNGQSQTEVVDISKQLQYMEQMSLQHSEGNAPIDEETKFIQELGQISAQVDVARKESGQSSDHVDHEDFDEMMAMLQQLGAKESKSNSPLPKPTSNGSGWKAGFLGGNGNNKGSKKSDKVETKSARIEEVHSTANTSPTNAATESNVTAKRGVSFSAENEVRTIDDASTVSHNPSNITQKPPVDSTAVLEKNVPPPPKPLTNTVLEKPAPAPKPLSNTIVEKNVASLPRPVTSSIVEKPSPALPKPLNNNVIEKEVQGPKPLTNTVLEKSPSGPKPLPMKMMKK